MGRKTVNIDTLLAEDSLELIMNGKAYIIVDVEMSVFLMASKTDEPDENILIDQLSKILGIDKEELSGIGLKTAALALEQIQKWVMDTSPGDEVAPKKNP